jgi:hypothetical protein
MTIFEAIKKDNLEDFINKLGEFKQEKIYKQYPAILTYNFPRDCGLNIFRYIIKNYYTKESEIFYDEYCHNKFPPNDCEDIEYYIIRYFEDSVMDGLNIIIEEDNFEKFKIVLEEIPDFNLKVDKYFIYRYARRLNSIKIKDYLVSLLSDDIIIKEAEKIKDVKQEFFVHFNPIWNET